MKQIFTKLATKALSAALLGGLVLAGNFGWTQQRSISLQDQVVQNHGMDAAPGVIVLQNPTPHLTPAPPALWDVQLNVDMAAATSANGNAGVVFIGTEFWTSRWASDSLFRFDASGNLLQRFTIPGLTGTRGMTWDGTQIFAGGATTTIRRIDPVTKTVLGTITSPVAARHISYDPTLNAGAGGLYVGNFNTDIVAISLTGTTLFTITAATHGLTGMYGSAYDPYTTGGPYLWVFNQGGAGSQSEIARLSLPSGTPTGLIHDTEVDVSPAASLAGGLFITNQLVPGFNTLGGISQGGNDRLFAYELADYTAPSDDIRSLAPSYGGEYGFTPLNHVQALSFGSDIDNFGTNTATGITLDCDVSSGAGPQFNGQATLASLAPAGTATLNIPGTYTPSAIDIYDIIYALAMDSTDSDPSNNADTLTFFVTDTVYGRDNNVVSGSLGIGAGATGIMGQEFDMIVDDTITTVSFFLNSPTVGDTTKVVVYSMAPIIPSVPFQLIGESAEMIITDPNPMFYTLPVTAIGGGCLTVEAGKSYMVGIQEYFSNNITLGTNDDIFTMDNTWVYFNGSWGNSEDFGFEVAYLVRANLGDPTACGLVAVDDQLKNDGIVVYPNPTSGGVNVGLDFEISNDVTITVTDLVGKIITSARKNGVRSEVMTLDLSNQANGIYLVKVETPETTVIRKINLSK